MAAALVATAPQLKQPAGIIVTWNATKMCSKLVAIEELHAYSQLIFLL